MPAEVVAKLNAEVNKALSSDMREKLVSQGLEVSGGSVEDFVKFQREDSAKAQKIITEGKISAE
jgi:tripartite-type tricarboxylate transporter receptor subunit TctC